jgi:hypothetical protein
MSNNGQKSVPIQRVRLQFNDTDALDSLSAVERINDHLFLGADESASLERLTTDGRGGYSAHHSFPVGLSINLPDDKSDQREDKKKQEIDIEGLSRDGDFLWLVGSHSLKREKAKSKNNDPREMMDKLAKVTPEPLRYVLARIPLVETQNNGEVSLRAKTANPTDATDGAPSVAQAATLGDSPRGNTLIDALASDPHIGAFLPQGDLNDKETVAHSIPSKDNGFDIEGLAARGNRLFVGLRGPVLRGWAIVLELEAQAEPPNLKLREIGPKGQCYRKHFLRLDGLGVRDLCWRGDDLLVLAGPTMELDGPVRLYRWRGVMSFKDETITPRESLELLLDLPYGEGEDHAEGMTIIDDEGTTPLLLVVYDSPGKIRKVGNTAVYADLFALPD